MGNEGSQLSGLEIANEIIEVTNSWTLKNASLHGSSRPLSLFISQEESILQLEQAAKKLKLYRHPGIVKYVDTWIQSSSLYLATERVVPLAQVLPTLSSLQACLGLRSILSALVFLHDRAQVSHNNVCCASIYVASDGAWKLGNFEFLCNQQELSTAFLRERKPRRYEPAIAPDEDKGISVPSSVDVYAFGRLVQEVLKHKEVPGEFADAANNFLSIATTQLQQSKPEDRGNLAPLLEHSYFSHPVVAVVEFLSALTLKSADEKEQFFRSLWIQLATLPEVMVANQLADLLLSRLVLLESPAQQHLLPWLLAVRQDDLDSGFSILYFSSIQSGECSPIFSKGVFEQHIAPKLSRIFQVF
ncbi:hypothetical protein B566_EDAN017240 [Ephemera danica]|nr:hypothetical protein B566_EDAN017240 [Ephemera danica]